MARQYMVKQYCPYCGEPITLGCECERVAAEEQQALFEELEERSLENAWQQDVIDMYRRER